MEEKMKQNNTKAVFITGASTGIGKEAAILFSKKGWNVAATMRESQSNKADDLKKHKNIKIFHLDVTDMESVKHAVSQCCSLFGGIDVLVNNAGIYCVGPLETAKLSDIENLINTNLLGQIRVSREIVPVFRMQKSGTIINISSMAGRMSVPLQSLYHATKWGIEGFSESLQYELRRFNIKVKIIEPGVIKTPLYGTSMIRTDVPADSNYETYSQKVIGNILKNADAGSHPEDVAQTIFRAATDRSSRMRYLSGKNAGVVNLHSLLPTGVFMRLFGAKMES
jgi:NAD(P)-dependent dehydrogenase (short-subunit alcohol dehydrogenase family)